MITENNAKNAIKFYCEKCDFICCKKSNYEKHCLTRKHQINYNELPKKEQKMPKKYYCNCGKEYNYRQGLYTHRKSCNKKSIEPITINQKYNNSENCNNENTILNELDIKSLILELVKSNTDLQKQMLEVCKNNNTTINNNNSNNKTFNMQVFLNEKCKDAMNIMDIYKRPIHCSDLKRETIYVRDNDVWEKETETYDNLRKTIKYITKKNGDLMIPWRDAHPQCMKLEHPLNDTYLGIMNQAMGGKGEFFDSESKIIRKISKSVTIDKSDM